MKNIVIRKCPRCKTDIIFGKEKLVNCKCGARVLLYRMNNNLMIQDVTPAKEMEICGDN